MIKIIYIYLYDTIQPKEILRLILIFRPMNKIHFFKLCAASFLILLMTACSQVKQPYDLIDEHTFLQISERRNDSTVWKLVWEDEFEATSLDT